MKTINLYKFNDLSEKAQEKAINNYKLDQKINISTIENTIIEIANLFGCKYNIDKEYNLSFFGFEEDFLQKIKDMKGVRAYKYIYNNFIKPAQKGKRFYKTTEKGSLIRQSKLMFEDCPFTGNNIDLLYFHSFDQLDKFQPLIQKMNVFLFINKIKGEYTWQLKFAHSYFNSRVYISDMLNKLNWGFLEDGTVFEK